MIDDISFFRKKKKSQRFHHSKNFFKLTLQTLESVLFSIARSKYRDGNYSWSACLGQVKVVVHNWELMAEILSMLPCKRDTTLGRKSINLCQNFYCSFLICWGGTFFCEVKVYINRDVGMKYMGGTQMPLVLPKS